MDKQQFERLVSAVQWAVDDFLREQGTLPDPALGSGPHWDQGVWSRGRVVDSVQVPGGEMKVVCGTSFCLAGNIAAEAGDKFVVEPDRSLLDSDDIVADTCLTAEGRLMMVMERAKQLLGIEYDVVPEDALEGEDGSTWLFDSENDIEHLVRLADIIAEQHGHPGLRDHLEHLDLIGTV